MNITKDNPNRVAPPEPGMVDVAYAQDLLLDSYFDATYSHNSITAAFAELLEEDAAVTGRLGGWMRRSIDGRSMPSSLLKEDVQLFVRAAALEFVCHNLAEVTDELAPIDSDEGEI